jgi:hypothetical protein
VQYGGAFLFAVAYVWGVIDGYANQKPNITENRKEKLLKPGEQAWNRSDERRRWMPIIVPIIASDTVGLVAAWEF